MELKDFARAVSFMHNKVGAAALEVASGKLPRRPLMVVGLRRITVTGRIVPPKVVRRLLWESRGLPRIGDPCVATWYNDGTGCSEVMYGVATWRRRVADKILRDYPEAAIVEVQRHG